MKRPVLLACLVCALWIAACTSQPTPTPESVAAETETPPAPTETPLVIPTRQPLPPTWTPGGAARESSGPATATRLPITPNPTATLPTDCTAFRADYDRIGDTFTVGSSPVLYWEPIEGVPQYRVEVIDPAGEPIWVTYVPGDSSDYAIPADVFVVDEQALALGTVFVFGWEVTPVNEQQAQYCPSAGGELIPVRAQ